MKNCEIKTEGTKLIIVIDLSKSFGPSKSGKTVIVASTEGNAKIGSNGVQLGLNVFKPMS
jgi:hypothetical protein